MKQHMNTYVDIKEFFYLKIYSLETLGFVENLRFF